MAIVKFPMGKEVRFRNSIGPQLRKLRMERHLTQDAFAGKLQRAGLDLDRTAIAKIETRLRSVFDYELAMIARELGVPGDALQPSRAELTRILPDLRKGMAATQTRKPQE